MSQGGQGQSPMNYQNVYNRPQFGYGGGYQTPDSGIATNMTQFGGNGTRNYYGGGQPAIQNTLADTQARFRSGGQSANWQPQGSGLQYQPPQAPQSWGSGGFTGMEFIGGGPQMSGEFQYQPKGGLINPGRNMISQAPQDSAPGFMVNQTQPVQQPQQPQQSFEQFAATLGNNGMTSGQMQDAYQKSLQPASTNFWANTGVGTQKPNGFVTPPEWGQQTYGFDPRAMAGKQVTGDLGWYYGRDAIGRTINNQGDAVAGFSRPADGFQRSRPWFG